MKKVKILHDGEFLFIKENDTKIFLQADNILALIHLVEEQKKNFKRRIEFKRRIDDNYRHISFSYYLDSNTIFSGELTISSNSEITGLVSYHILRPNSTRIKEEYHLTIDSDSYYLEHITTPNIEKTCIEKKKITALAITEIDVFLFNILNKINNIQCIKNKYHISYPPSISHILNEENNIISIIESLVERYPELEAFLKRYQQIYTRKRTFPSWFNIIIW